MALTENEIAERIEEGSLRVLMTLEVAGQPVEHVELSLDSYLKQIEDEKHLEILDLHKERAVELEGENEGFFSAFAEVELLVPQLETLTQLAFNFTPASIEVLEPEEFHIAARDVQNWINDILSKLHAVALEVRGEKQKNTYYNTAILRLAQNFITVLLAGGPKDSETLARMTGIEAKPLEGMLEKFSADGIIQEEEGTWTLSSSEK